MFYFLPSEEFLPWLGPDFQLVHLRRETISLEEIIACWGPAAPVVVESGLPALLAGAYGLGPPVEPVTPYYFDQSTDPDSKLLKPTDICLADPMDHTMPEIECPTLNSSSYVVQSIH